MDHMINVELEKAYDLFDMYASLPMDQEMTWINKVLEVIGCSDQNNVTEADLAN